MPMSLDEFHQMPLTTTPAMNIRNLRLVAWIITAGLAHAASAQTPPAVEPAPQAPAAVSDQPPAVPAADLPPPAQPTAPVAEELPPALDPAAKKADAPKPVPVISADEKGFAFKSSADKPAFVLKLKLVAQLDARKFLEENNVNDTMSPRRLRPYLDGTLLDLVDYRLLVDFAGGTAVVFDAYADIHPTPWLRFRYGKFKSPIGLERLQSDPDLEFIERALTSALTPDRDVGLMVWGDIAGGIVNYSAGVFDGSADSGTLDTDNGVHKDLAGRLLIQPFKAKSLESLGNLGVAIAGTWGKRDGKPTATGLNAYRTVGRQDFFKYLAPTANAMTPDVSGTTVYAAGEQTRINPELFYYYGGFGILGEAVWSKQEVHVGAAKRKLTHRAAHGTLSYVLWGKNGLDGATPTDSWNPAAGHYGALEFAARYHWLDIDDDSFPLYSSAAASATRAQGFGLAANWVLSRTFRLAVNFEDTKFKGGAANGADRKTEKVFLGRAQVAF